MFLAMLTQWRASFGGVIGLDYAALPFLFDLYGIKKKKRADIFRKIQILESGALEAIHERSR